MRAAEEIIKGKESGSFGNNDWYYSRVNVIKLINESRKEAIEEASQIAYTIGEPEVGEEIRNLINELK